jgi:hypothetical protein
MFDNYDPPEAEEPRDWSGTLIGLATLPVFFVFAYLGKEEVGFTVCIVLAIIGIAIRLRWKLRKHVWFWATIALVLALHVPFLSIIHWPDTKVPTIAYAMPLGIADFLIVSGALALAEKLFSKQSPSDGEG